MSLVEDEAPHVHLEVRVGAGEDLLATKAFLALSLTGGQYHHTTARHGLRPHWDESFDFCVAQGQRLRGPPIFSPTEFWALAWVKYNLSSRPSGRGPQRSPQRCTVAPEEVLRYVSRPAGQSAQRALGRWLSVGPCPQHALPAHRHGASPGRQHPRPGRAVRPRRAGAPHAGGGPRRFVRPGRARCSSGRSDLDK